jgi:hypothetical protein
MNPALLTAIALWCGQPVAPVQIGTDIVITRSPLSVQECRDRLFECVSKKKDTECFTKEKIK